jgi:hypothetical protein
MKFMKINKILSLVELPIGVKSVGCKKVYKIKINSQYNIEWYKTWLVVKEFTQQK